MTKLSQEEFAAWTKYIYSICGISLDASKGYLVETRLSAMLREHNLDSYSELFYKVKSDFSGKLKQQIIDAITTNETSFFRDSSPFELLRNKILPDLIDRRTKTIGAGRTIPLRIWSAACSTGQEVYSTAITAHELTAGMGSFDIRITGTDISDQAIAKASHAYYTQMELSRGMQADKIRKHFVAEGTRWKVKDEIRAMAVFQKINLLQPLPFIQKFDIVFCRNVAIYFTEPDKINLFKAIGRVLAPDGYLIIGSTESLTGLCPEYVPQRYLRSVFYQHKNFVS